MIRFLDYYYKPITIAGNNNNNLAMAIRIIRIITIAHGQTEDVIAHKPVKLIYIGAMLLATIVVFRGFGV